MIFPYRQTAEKGPLSATTSSSHEPPLAGVGGQLLHDYTSGGTVPVSCAPRQDLGAAHHPTPTASPSQESWDRRSGGSVWKTRSMCPSVTGNPPPAPRQAHPAGDTTPCTCPGPLHARGVRTLCPQQQSRPGGPGGAAPALSRLSCTAPAAALARLRPGDRPAWALRASSSGAAPPPARCRSLPHDSSLRRQPRLCRQTRVEISTGAVPAPPPACPPPLRCTPGSGSPAARVPSPWLREKGLQLPGCSAPGRERAGRSGGRGERGDPRSRLGPQRAARPWIGGPVVGRGRPCAEAESGDGAGGADTAECAAVPARQPAARRSSAGGARGAAEAARWSGAGSPGLRRLRLARAPAVLHSASAGRGGHARGLRDAGPLPSQPLSRSRPVIPLPSRYLGPAFRLVPLWPRPVAHLQRWGWAAQRPSARGLLVSVLAVHMTVAGRSPHRIPLLCFLLPRLAFVRPLTNRVGQLCVALLCHGHGPACTSLLDGGSRFWCPYWCHYEVVPNYSRCFKYLSQHFCVTPSSNVEPIYLESKLTGPYRIEKRIKGVGARFNTWQVLL